MRQKLIDSNSLDGLAVMQNDGPEIIHTNFWLSGLAKQGRAMLSAHAETFRLLVPPKLENEIPDMIRGCREVLLYRGKWNDNNSYCPRTRPNCHGRDTWEIIFEDGSGNEYSLHIDVEIQTFGFLPPDRVQGQRFPFVIWTESGKVFTTTCRYKRVSETPWLKPWPKQKVKRFH